MKKNKTKPSPGWSMDRESGFTLIEILIAITILTVGLLGVASMQVSAIRGNDFSASVTTGLCLAEDRMEELMRRPYSDDLLADLQDKPLNTIIASDVDHEDLPAIDASGQTVTGGPYRRVWNVEDSAAPDMKTVTVIVTWDNNRHRVSLTSIKSPGM
jgi:prepilin-type N-terminal cleavage/methylation domain-containing protein